MLVLVTGAAGHLGSATCQQLAAAGIEFRATDARTRKGIPFRVQVENLLHREACYALVEGCEAVVHFANRPNEHAGSPQEVFGENAQMNINVFQAAHDLGVKKIIFASSVQAITGSRRVHQAETKPTGIPYLPADGDLPGYPGNHYSASKVAGETLLKYFAEHRGLESGVAIRFPGMVLPEWFDWMKRHMNVDHLWRDENIDELFTWLTFADAGRLVAACLRTNLPGYRCYFPAHPAPRANVSAQELAKRFYSAAQLKCPSDQLTALIDISKITAETGWAPQDDYRQPASSPEPQAKAG